MRRIESRRIGEMASNEFDTRAVLTLVLGDAFAKLSDVRWSHATNSVAQLAHATSDSRPVDFVEADLLLSPEGILIMAHPPATTSDLTFEAFLNRFAQLAAQPNTRPLGLKLDFKDPHAVEPCLKMLSAAVAKAGAAWRHPIWLNADIFTGPGGKRSAFDADIFLRQCSAAALPGAALSLGWTTGWHPLTCIGLHGYSAAHVEEGLSVVAKLQRPMAVTWAVRAAIIRQTSPALVRRLCEHRRTLTVWGDAGPSELAWLAATHIAPIAFVDIAAPTAFLQITWLIQICSSVLLAGAALVVFQMLQARDMPLARGMSHSSYQGR